LRDTPAPESCGRDGAGGLRAALSRERTVPLKCIVLDFDGTFTDVAREAAPFLVEFRAGLIGLIGRPEAEAAWDEAEREILAHPMRHGWESGGRVVAPGNADPYIRASCVAQLLFERFDMLSGHEERAAVVQSLYYKAYRGTAAVFRPDARATLARIIETRIPTFVITNARPDTVQQKVRALLGDAHGLEILGDAQKFLIAPPSSPDPAFDRLPEERWLPGLDSRPVYVRRGRYFDALRRVWAAADAAPVDALVVGDIFELDLALPAELGAQVHRLARPETADYEKAAVESLSPRGAWSEELSAVLSRIEA
jgi:FMN phosphatase YigB (HAD superfamily)